MLTSSQSSRLSKILALGSLVVTILVFSGIGYDPVNLPKAFALTLMAGFCFGIWSFSFKKIVNTEYRLALIFFAAAAIAILVTTLFGRAPLAMNLYGTYARNTGAITYICFIVIAISAMLLNDRNQVNRILNSFLIALVLNVFYGVYVVITGKDPFPWNNPYGNFLGTFGNPNFISAFLGIGFSVSLALFLTKATSKYLRVLMLVLLPVEIFLILDTDSLQGLIVAIFGTGIVGFFFIKDRLKKIYLYAYSTIAGVSASLIILGMLQIGPLVSYVYKSSVSIRGEYWRAGVKMFLDSPFLGIGLDSYGDFYRRMRSASALVLPGVGVQTDASHNVFVDILAGGGLLLFVPYLCLQLLVFFKAITFIKKNSKFDPVFIALFVGWIAYLGQSLISINQIGVAIWGWIFTGLLLAYTGKSFNFEIESGNISKGKKKNQTTSELTAGNFITVTASLLVAFIIAFPPVMSDYRWKTSLKNQKIEEIVKATNNWPQNNQRYIQTAQILAQSNYISDSLNLLRDGTKFDPDFRDYWFFIYNLTSNELEKIEALQNLKRLDPLNPDYK